MPEYSAGEAKLRIVPDASDFKRRLEADMSKIKAEFAINVTAQTAQARADIERFKEVQRRDPIKVGVDLGLAEADAKMAAFRARQRANDVNVKVNADTGGALKTIGELDKQLDSILGTLASGLKLNLSIAGIGELPAASLAIADVAGAIQQLAQAGLAVPGILAGVVSSIGTLAFGVSGIGDAYSAVTKASDSAGQSQVRSANTAARAQREYTDAVRDAKQQLEDLTLTARGDQISQQQAVLNAQKARRQLQRDLASGSIKDQLDLQEHLLDIQSADQQVAESVQRGIENQQKLAQAQKDGVAGNERVIAANEAIANAAEASGSATDAAARKMAQLAPNAKDFAQTLVDLRPVIKDLQRDDANAIFDGLGKSLKDLVDADLPTVRTGIVGIGTAWNGTLKQLMTSLGSDSSKGFLERILGNTADAQTRAQKAIDPIVHALGTLTAAGSDALPRLADGFDRLATRFDNFITEADKDGSLQRWISEGLTAVSNLGDTILNLGKSFTAVTRALGGGEGLLGLLDQGSKKLADFLNSTEGQNKLKAWFEEGRREIQEHIIPLLQSLPGFFEGLYKAGRTIADTVVPPLRDISQFLAEHKRLVADVVVAFAAWKSISGIASLITDLQKISDLLGVPGSKGNGGKGGIGGKGVLGKLALVTGGALLLDNLVNGDDTPKTDATPSTAAPSAVQPGDIPVGQPVPFGGIPGAGANRDTVTGLAPVAAGAAAGAAQGGPAGAVIGGALAIPGAVSDAMRPVAPGSPAEAEATFNSIVDAIPRITDDGTLKQFADAFQLTPDQLKAMTRDDLHKRWLAIQQGQPLPPLPAAPAGPADALAPDFFLPKPPGYRQGGATPSGPGNGPTGGHIIETHGDEWVVSERGRASVPDSFLKALDQGKVAGFWDGGDPGMVDAWGNPVTPGPAPGDPGAQPVAPNPLAGGGGISSIIGQFVSGLGNPISNLTSIAQAGAGQAQAGGLPGMEGVQAPSFADRAAQLPGLAGLIASAGSSNPQSALMNWGGKTASWLGNFTAKTVGGFASALWDGGGKGGGILGFLGLQNSILSSSNPYNQAAQQTGQFFLDKGGPLGTLLGAGGGGSDLPYGGDSNTIGMQTYTAADGTTYQVPTYATSGSPDGGTGATVLNPASRASSFGGDKVSYTPDFLLKQGIAPLYTRTTDAKGNSVAQIPDWANKLAGAFGLTATSHSDSTLHGGQSGRGDSINTNAGWAFDFSGAPADEQRFADFIQGNLSAQTLQAIWQNPKSGQQLGIAGGQLLGPGQYYNTPGGSYADHTDHVHWATDVAPNLYSPNGQPLIPGLPPLAGAPSGAPSLAGLPVGAGGQGALLNLALAQAGAPKGGPQGAVFQAMLGAGFPPSEWSALNEIVSHESSWRLDATNPSSGAFGLFQFLGHQGDYPGGYSSDPAQQAMAGLAYIKARYGSPSAAWDFWQKNHWYAAGGETPSWMGPIDSKGGHLSVLHPKEFVISQRGRSRVPDAFLHALNQGLVDPKDLPGFETGGEVPPPAGLPVVPPPRPNFQVPNAQPKLVTPPPRPTPAPAAVAPATPAPPATPQPPTTPAPQSTAPQGPEQATYQPGVPATAANPTDGSGMINHNIAAVDTLIKSTANTAATVASTAISMAGSLGAMGGGAGAGAGAGLLGQFVGGVIQQGGKVADQIANVVSSSLVGNVPGSMGAPGARAYGQQLHAQQRVPVTAPDTGAGGSGGDTYNFNGMDVGKVFDQLELQRARDAQARNAKYGG